MKRVVPLYDPELVTRTQLKVWQVSSPFRISHALVALFVMNPPVPVTSQELSSNFLSQYLGKRPLGNVECW